MKTNDFDYHLPEERIAQTPVEPRDSSRLLVLHKDSDLIEHRIYRDVVDYLQPGDLLVLNQTKVIPARLFAEKDPSGGKIEILLLKRLDEVTWEAIIGGKRMTVGKRFKLSDGTHGKVTQVLEGSKRVVRFEHEITAALDTIGEMPLPPYIHEKLHTPDRYQTVFAHETGSAAAPTAGLHFTEDLLQKVQAMGVRIAYVTLHVGLDTFMPVMEEDPLEHHIHTEWCTLTPENAKLINETHRNGGRIIAVGTTSVRTLETAARYVDNVGDKSGENFEDNPVEKLGISSKGDIVGPFATQTDLFILPGYQFKVVDCILTNFHLPKSTLIMLISSFVGREKLLTAYHTAVEEKYRFYSFGDAMFIL